MNKPAGLVCHPTRGDEMSSLVGRLRLYFGDADSRLVNRLDRETSGIVLVARTATAARELGILIAQANAVRKKYWAIVHGHVAESHIAIDAPLGRDERSEVAIKDRVRTDGAPAQTTVDVIQRFDRDQAAFTWLGVTPATGRKHQIRIHLAHIGHSIVGDKIYGPDERLYLRFITGTLTEGDHRVLLSPSHLLHARLLEFEWRGQSWSFEAPPDPQWDPWLGRLRPAAPGIS